MDPSVEPAPLTMGVSITPLQYLYQRNGPKTREAVEVKGKQLTVQ